MIHRDHTLHVKRISETGWFSGYASVFHHVDQQADAVLPGAFASCVERWRSTSETPKMLWQHDVTRPIGRWEILEERPQGLYVEGRLFLELIQGREAYVLLKEGVIDGLSIGYTIIRARRQKDHRVLEALDVREISLVTFPANDKARILDVKETHDWRGALDQIDRCRGMVTVR